MPRKYTRRNLSPEHPAPGATPVEQGAPPAAEPMAPLYAPQLTALEQYGLWLKQNQHVTNPLPPEPPKPRKPAHVPRPRY